MNEEVILFQALDRLKDYTGITNTPCGYFTLWFRKINGEWKIVCDHTS
jgi:hypothetical protein